MNVKTFRTCGAVVACLFLARAFLGCHPTPEAVMERAVARGFSRPIDVDPAVLERVGREALAKVGYIPIMNLARQEGWVTTKERKSIPNEQRALFGMDGAAASRGFVEVFTKYAVVAGVTTQADSPAPGPADVVAIGIVVVGLIDAALLAGAIWNAVSDAAPTATGSTTSAPPTATTLPVASAAPTTTAPPIATWVPVTQVETAEEKKERCEKVKAECREDCNHLTGQGYRPPRPGKRGRGRAGGGTNTQFDFHRCYDDCKAAHGCQ